MIDNVWGTLLESLEPRRLLTAYVWLDSYGGGSSLNEGWTLGCGVFAEGVAGQLQVNYRVTGTATEGIDYRVTDYAGSALSGTITLDWEQWNEAQLVTLRDNLVEGNETLVFELLPGDGYVLGYPPGWGMTAVTSQTVTISDDPPVVGIAKLRDGHEDGQDILFQIGRAGGDIGQALVVQLDPPGGTATPGEDYVLPGTITVPAGQSSVEFTVTPIDDGMSEETETLIVQAASNAHHVFAGLAAVAEIIDNDYNIVEAKIDYNSQGVKQDDGSGVYGLVAGSTPLITTEWTDADGDPATAADNIAAPLSHVRSMPGAASTLTAQVSFKTDKLPAGSYEVEGTATGPGGFSATLKANAAINGQWLVANVAADQALPDTIQYDDLLISWKVNRTHNGKVSPKTYGQTKNTSYITGAAVADEFETVLYIGCKNAAWKRPANPGEAEPDASNRDREVVDAIWLEFADRQVTRAGGGNPMKYWGPLSSTSYSDPLRQDENFTKAGLIKHADGRCGAWAELFKDILTAQGIAATIMEVTPAHGAGPGPAGEVPLIDVFIVNPTAPGQGGAPGNNIFADHAVVEYGGKIYDPSYGTAFDNRIAWESNSIVEFGTFYGFDVTDPTPTLVSASDLIVLLETNWSAI